MRTVKIVIRDSGDRWEGVSEFGKVSLEKFRVPTRAVAERFFKAWAMREVACLVSFGREDESEFYFDVCAPREPVVNPLTAGAVVAQAKREQRAVEEAYRRQSIWQRLIGKAPK